MEQRATYNGHKGFDCLKFQAVVAPDGLILHLYGTVEGRRHYRTMFIESNLSVHLSDTMEIDGVQYYIFGDAAYVLRPFQKTGCQNINLTDEQQLFNTKMAEIRVL